MSNGSEGKDVLSSLPRSRPERRSTKRDGARASKPKAKAATKPTPKPAAASKPKAKPKVGHATRPSAATRRARAETAMTPSPKAEQVAPANRDIVTTTVQAAGELARIGLTVGTQIVREATRRLPKP
jgi:hypothetical protein